MIDIMLVLIAATITAVGVFLQKMGLKRVKKWRDVIKSYKWILGLLILFPAFFLYILALREGRLSIIQPLGNFSIIVLFVLEAMFLKEKIKKHEIFALILFFIGILLMGL